MTLVDYTYDLRNRLTAVDNVTYTYDAENNRLSQSTQTPTGNSTTFYTTDPHGSLLPSVLIKHNSDGTKTYYIY
ncbi:MAG: hypothetical protein LBS59_08220, partial [Puniceicoccales bacterium]|nr:hypothetical protein [Puniceicoccales bacterium]